MTTRHYGFYQSKQCDIGIYQYWWSVKETVQHSCVSQSYGMEMKPDEFHSTDFNQSSTTEIAWCARRFADHHMWIFSFQTHNGIFWLPGHNSFPLKLKQNWNESCSYKIRKKDIINHWNTSFDTSARSASLYFHLWTYQHLRWVGSSTEFARPSFMNLNVKSNENSCVWKLFEHRTGYGISFNSHGRDEISPWSLHVS